MAVVLVGGEKLDIVHIAAQLNAEFDIPAIPENVEQVWLEWIVGKIAQVLPPELITLLTDAADGLTDEEITEHTETLTKLANQIIDIPLLTESIEASLIRPVVKQLLSYAKTGRALTLTAGA